MESNNSDNSAAVRIAGEQKDSDATIATDFEVWLYSLTTNPELKALDQKVPDFKSDFETVFKNDIIPFFTNPGTVAGSSLADLGRLLADVFDIILNVTGYLATEFISFFHTVIQSLIDFLNQPLDEGGFLGDLFQAIGGGKPLTIVNLAALAVAIPATLIEKIINPSTDEAAKQGPKDAGSYDQVSGPVLFSLALVKDGFLELINSLLEASGTPNPWISRAVLGLSAVAFALSSAPVLLIQPGIQYDCMVIAGLFPLLFGGVGLLAEDAPPLNSVLPYVKMCYALAFGSASIAYAGIWSDDFLKSADDGATLAQALIGQLGSIIGPAPEVTTLVGFPEFKEVAAAAVVAVTTLAGFALIAIEGVEMMEEKSGA